MLLSRIDADVVRKPGIVIKPSRIRPPAVLSRSISNQVMFLQDMPTKEWGEDEVEPLLSQAYILSTLFEGSPNHLGAS